MAEMRSWVFKCHQLPVIKLWIWAFYQLLWLHIIAIDLLCLCKSNFMKSLLSAAYHQCNIFSNHFTYSPSSSSPSPSPSMTITIYHQHRYHHYYHHGLCHYSFHPAMNHSLLHAMCPLFVSLCDSLQTYSVIVPAEAVWQPDQLHFDDARAYLPLHLQLMASISKGEQWGLWPLEALTHPILHACKIQFPECRRLTLSRFSCVMTILTSRKGLCGHDRDDMSCQDFCTVCLLSVENFSISSLHL